MVCHAMSNVPVRGCCSNRTTNSYSNNIRNDMPNLANNSVAPSDLNVVYK